MANFISELDDETERVNAEFSRPALNIISTATRQLAEARKLSQWVRIDEEHLPKEGDEVGYWSVTGLGELWLVRTVAVNWNLSQCRSARWTHYRPNNSPTGKESHD